MPDEPVPPPPPSEPPAPPIPFHIGEEFGTAKKNLPPVKIVVISVVAIVAIATIYAIFNRAHSPAVGTIDDVVSVEIPNQSSVMVAMNVSIQNNGEKPFWIHNMKAVLDTGTTTVTDEAASNADFERYFQAFPALKEHALPALKVEDKIDPGGSAKGTIIVTFPVTPQDFANRKSLKVTIWPYDQGVPLEITK